MNKREKIEKMSDEVKDSNPYMYYNNLNHLFKPADGFTKNGDC